MIVEAPNKNVFDNLWELIEKNIKNNFETDFYN
jgi:hypothetical protein